MLCVVSPSPSHTRPPARLTARARAQSSMSWPRMASMPPIFSRSEGPIGPDAGRGCAEPEPHPSAGALDRAGQGAIVDELAADGFDAADFLQIGRADRSGCWAWLRRARATPVRRRA